MRNPLVFVLLIVCAFVIGSCDNAFSPKGEFQNKIVVFSVLTLQDDKQFVRVYSTYDPPGYDPTAITSDSPITDADVVIIGPSQPPVVYMLHDTTVQRLDTTRYTTPVRAYVTSGMRLTPDGQYTLTVSSPNRGTVSATTAVPSHATLDISDRYVLTNPSMFSDMPIVVTADISAYTKGYVIRFFLQYKYTTGGVDHVETKEVPVSVSGTGISLQKVYPGLVRRTSVPSGSSLSSESVSFDAQAYINTMAELADQLSAYSLSLQKAIFVLTQVEENLYNYYCVVNGFQDPYSIRMDQPDYSNIRGGVGLFGGRTVDSLVYTLPAVIR